MSKVFPAFKFVIGLIFSFSTLAILVPISAQSQTLPDSVRFNQNTSILNNFGLDSPADLENIGNSVEPLPVLRPQELNFSPASPAPFFTINVPIGLCMGSYQERQEQQKRRESESNIVYGPGSKCPGDP